MTFLLVSEGKPWKSRNFTRSLRLLIGTLAVVPYNGLCLPTSLDYLKSNSACQVDISPLLPLTLSAYVQRSLSIHVSLPVFLICVRNPCTVGKGTWRSKQSLLHGPGQRFSALETACGPVHVMQRRTWWKGGSLTPGPDVPLLNLDFCYMHIPVTFF